MHGRIYARWPRMAKKGAYAWTHLYPMAESGTHAQASPEKKLFFRLYPPRDRIGLTLFDLVVMTEDFLEATFEKLA